MREVLVRTYWRDNANPFPGRLIEEKRVKISAAERAWHDYVRRTMAERDEREWAAWQSDASRFEALADQAQANE